MVKNKFMQKLLVLFLAFMSGAAFVGCGNASESSSSQNEKILDVVLLGGHSNALGLSVWTEPDLVYDDVKFFGYGESVNVMSVSQVRWKKVQNGLGQNLLRFGPEMGIAQVCSEHYESSDRDIGIIKYSWGGQKLYDYFLSPTSVEQGIGNLNSTKKFSDDEDEMVCAIGFWNTIKTVRAAKEQALKNGYSDVNILAMCWMQGESDACKIESASIYDKMLANFMADIRFYLSASDLPFAIGQVTPPSEAIYLEMLTQKQKEVVNADGNAEFIKTDDLKMKSDDLWHYDTASMKELGKRFGESVFRLIG